MLGSFLQLIGGHWTGSIWGRHQERRDRWWQDFRALASCSVWWQEPVAIVLRISTLWFRNAPKARLHTCVDQPEGQRWRANNSVIVSQYRRLLSSCIVRAQAQCLISRVGVISPQAREAAKRREVSGKGVEGGADCPMDGDIEGSWVGKERQMPYGLVSMYGFQYWLQFQFDILNKC